MQLYIVCLYLETSLHVSGGTSTHHQERIQLYLQHPVFFTTLVLPAALVEGFELLQLYTVYLYVETALLVSGGTTTHYQERVHLYLQNLVFVTLLLLPPAIVEELEKKFHLFHDSGR
jgi:hypothetical protein